MEIMGHMKAHPIANIVGFVTLSAFLLACSPQPNTPAPASGGQPRALDAQPIKTKLQVPLPEGRAEALFSLDTGKDQMGQTSRQAGLVAIVRFGEDEYRQTVATCPDPGLGSALGGGTERELEVAICNGEFMLVSEPNLVSVVPIENGIEGTAIARFELPSGVRAVSAKDK
jgi:hypothetical protein